MYVVPSPERNAQFGFHSVKSLVFFQFGFHFGILWYSLVVNLDDWLQNRIKLSVKSTKKHDMGVGAIGQNLS